MIKTILFFLTLLIASPAMAQHPTGGRAAKHQAVATATRAAISPLLDTYSIAWGQEPGNYAFPGSSSNWYYNNTIAGCVSTAVAQVMYYWYCKERFQGNQTTTIPAYTTTTNGHSVPELTGAHTFNWGSMNSSSRNNGGSQSAGELMKYFGCAVHMDYGTSNQGGSNSWIPEIPYALKTYFGYDQGVHLAYRMDYTYDEWVDLIYNELAAGRPVIFGGAATSLSNGSINDPGHCYVIDGYRPSYNEQSGDWFHFNWGWSGQSDGYFQLTNQDNHEFDIYNDAVIGFQPPREGSTAYDDPHKDRYCVSDITFSGPSTFTRNSRTDDFTGVNIFNAIFNRTDQPLSMDGRAQYADFDIGLGLYDQEGTLLRVLGERHYGEMLLGDGWGDQFCWNGLSLGAELPDDDYIIKAISRKHGTGTWLPDHRSDRRYITATISGNTLTLKPSAYITCEEETTSTGGWYPRTTTTIKLTNNGTEEATGNLYYWSDNNYYRNSNSRNTMAGVQMALPAGESTTDLINYGNISSGSINYISTDRMAKNIIYRKQSSGDYIALSDSIDRYFDDQYTPFAKTYTARSYNNQIGGTLIGNDLNVKVTLANKGTATYSGTLTASIGSSASKQQQNIKAEAGKSMAADFSFKGLSYDRKYTLTLTAGHESIDTTFTVRRGIIIGYGDGSRGYIADGQTMAVPDDAVWVDARYTNEANAITPSANANCVYVLSDGSTTPSNLTDRNVVIGEKASAITLTDNAYGFDTPVTFTADNISYTRTFAEGYDGQSPHWSTLVVPFTVTGIMGNNCRGWFTGSKDTGKNMWVMSFAREEEGTVYFRYAGNTLEANKPYIITVAADAWGDRWNLVGKPITFTGTNATLTPRCRALDSHGTHDFVGRTFGLPRHYVYALNTEGDHFERTPHIERFGAFRAYFLQYGSTTAAAKAMRIAIDDEATTGITLPTPDGQHASAWYDLQGRQLTKRPAQAGVYICNGKKVIIK